MAELTDKQRKFCEEYLIDLNATQAAIRAGYSENSANEIASQNLAKLNIQEYLSKRQKELSEATGITQKKVIEEYAKIAFVDIREVFGPDNVLFDVRQIDDSTAAAISSVEVDEMKMGGITIGNTKKIKFHDKIRALEALGKHLGIFEKDNKQKSESAKVTIFQLPDNGRGSV